MTLTAEKIQRQQFRVRFKGFDIREVDRFLEQVAAAVTDLHGENDRLRRELRRVNMEVRAFREREATFNQAIINCEQVAQQVRENAEKTAELMVAEAKVKAERTLNRAHARLAQLHEDIAELKRQRKKIESQIQTIIETHTRMLELGKEEETDALDEEDKQTKILRLKQ